MAGLIGWTDHGARSIEGGTLYPVKAGDTLDIPANMPHQFFVGKGKHWVITLVKITPRL